MTPNLSLSTRAVRVCIGAAVILMGAALWPGSLDLWGLLGVITVMTGIVGWCPVSEWWSDGSHNTRGSTDRQ
jgi:predicted anti-sigma-YlaC factor YlaD